MLLSFKNNKEIKEKILVSTEHWLNKKRIPLPPEEMAKKIFSLTRTLTKSECVLEDYENFPDNLGLPNWLGNLLFTIHHHNSKDFSLSRENYEEYFYPAFLKACNIGIDYSLMFHKWELLILTDLLPEQERDKKYFHDLIRLHENAIDGKYSENAKWSELQDAIDRHLQKVEPRTTTWNSGRTAYLSIENYVNQEDPYTTSSEAIVDSLISEYRERNVNLDHKTEQVLRKKIWSELMEKLLIMLKEWN